MPKPISKQEDLRENLKIAEYMLKEAVLKATDSWVNHEVEKQQAIIAAANARISAIRSESVDAKSKLVVLQRDVDVKNKAYADWVNRGTIEKASDAQAQLVDLISKLQRLGKTDDEIRQACGL